MGNKIKITDTSGNRIQKKTKPNEAEITSMDSFISVSTPSVTSSVAPGGVFYVSSGASAGSVQYNVNGRFYGDSGFLRDSISGTTTLEQQQNNNIGAGFILSTASDSFFPFDFSEFSAF